MRQSYDIHKTLMDQLTGDDMTTFTSEDRQEAYQKKVEEAPYHPGYEDAVVTPTPKYVGMDPARMIWKPKPLSEEEIKQMILEHTHQRLLDGDRFAYLDFARAVEERHGIK